MVHHHMKSFLALHILLAVYSLSGICSKLAAGQPFFSPRFSLYYVLGVAVTGLYAIGWQQIIKHLPLTVAFANKAVTVVWGMLWGALWFQEQITFGKIFGAALVVLGVTLFGCADRAENYG